MTEAQYQAEARRIAASKTLLTKTGGTINMIGDDKEVLQYANVLLMRDDHCIVRVIATQKKSTMPRVYPAVIDGVTYVIDAEPVEAAPVDTDKAKRVKAEGGKTKIAHCRELFAQHKADLTKEAMIELFMSEANCTKMGANTYYLTCKKEG